MAHRGENACDQHRRERSGEDEARGIATNAVDNALVGRDIAAHHAECLAQRAFDNVDPVRGFVALRNAAAVIAIHAHGVNLVDIGQRVVFFGKVANLVNRRHVSVHRIDAFESDHLGGGRILSSKKFLEIHDIIVPEHALVAARIADARDHAGVVQLVRKDHAPRQQLSKRR